VIPPVCAEPLDLLVLIDYWLNELPPSQEERVEEHLLGCAVCSESIDDFAALIGAVRSVGNRGLIRAVVTTGFLERLIDEGLRVREYRVAPGGRVQCTVTPSDDLVAARLTADLRGTPQVDLVKCDAEGREQQRLKDIPVGPSAQEIVFLERIDRVRALPACVQHLRLVATNAGGEQLVAEYTFIHTPSSVD